MSERLRALAFRGAIKIGRTEKEIMDLAEKFLAFLLKNKGENITSNSNDEFDEDVTGPDDDESWDDTTVDSDSQETKKVKPKDVLTANDTYAILYKSGKFFYIVDYADVEDYLLHDHDISEVPTYIKILYKDKTYIPGLLSHVHVEPYNGKRYPKLSQAREALVRLELIDHALRLKNS